MEKSSEGLARSLLHQVFDRYPELIPIPSQASASSGPGATSGQSYRPIGAWTERRRQATLQSVMLKAKGLCRMCIFIDGLDEISGDEHDLITLIHNLQTIDVKVYLSSRPHRSYNDAYGSYAMLRLQDLTEGDIEACVG